MFFIRFSQLSEKITSKQNKIRIRILRPKKYTQAQKKRKSLFIVEIQYSRLAQIIKINEMDIFASRK